METGNPPYSTDVLSRIQNVLSREPEGTASVPEVRTNIWGSTALILPVTYLLPRSHFLHGFAEEDLERYCAQLLGIAPMSLSGASVVPAVFMKRDHGSLAFVRPLSHDDHQYLFLFNVFTRYFGGAKPDEIRTAPRGDFGPSVLTNRIYFECSLVPAGSVQTDGARVSGCTVKTADEMLGESLSVATVSAADRRSFGGAIFEEPDFTSRHRSLTELALAHEWTLEQRFWPLVYRHRTVALNMVIPDFRLAQDILPSFHHFILSLEHARNLDFVYTDPGLREFIDGYETAPVHSRSRNREFVVRHRIYTHQ